MTNGLLAGLIQGGLGFGGGIVMMPFFMSIGAHPLVAAACSCYITMFGAFQNSVQFVVVG